MKTYILNLFLIIFLCQIITGVKGDGDFGEYKDKDNSEDLLTANNLSVIERHNNITHGNGNVWRKMLAAHQLSEGPTSSERKLSNFKDTAKRLLEFLELVKQYNWSNTTTASMEKEMTP